ncbi:Cupin [Thalassospira xiamenensis M-5 = DSM 17429]|uniref:AraC family transcriptional regulator n=1 Tax=Thalassospira xiamenensis M-5 = DSM 17429 TaxID=1123366 RepID=A0AB72UIC3_9PROT|nr:AraC family transcriptional regulator [Thalassospira xiamenensis]AJD53970.1 AraC family transcriptional regulator [Thalassospira xiamenensis M-5 = DSM 17429]SIS59494.1 Cupin [Thalassospira xiamenensis M-5 = DSM 17429]
MSEQTRNLSERDILSDVFGVNHPRGNAFFTGTLCGRSDHQGRDDKPLIQQGILHVLRSGSVRVFIDGRQTHFLDRPGLILFGKATRHEIETPKTGSGIVCANLLFHDAGPGPALLGIPDCLVLTFDEMPGLEMITGQLFNEAFEIQPGTRTAVNLLIDLLFLMVMRHCQKHGLMRAGILSALRDPRISRVVGALYNRPGHGWSVESQAELAGMSRAAFAQLFRDLLGISPGEFLQTIRLERAHALLQAGQRLQFVAGEVGYRSSTALARAILQKYGVSPRMLQGDLKTASVAIR